MTSAKTIERILKLNADGITVKQAAEQLKLTEQEIRDIILAASKPQPQKPPLPTFSDRPLFE